MSQILICRGNNLLACSRKIFSTFGFQPIPRNGDSLFLNVSLKSLSFQTASKISKINLHRPDRIWVSHSFKRFLSKKPNKLSFEIDANVSHDVTVFTYSNTRFFRMLSVFGIVQFFFWANMATFAYSGLSGGLNRGQGREDKKSWWNAVIDFQLQHRYRIAVACVALGYIVLFFTWVYPMRTISRLVLEKGGQMVRFTTYTHFGRTKDFVVPLHDISCTQSRLAKGVQVSLKIRGRWFYYLMDKRDGQFHDPRLFDYVIGLNRSLK